MKVRVYEVFDLSELQPLLDRLEANGGTFISMTRFVKRTWESDWSKDSRDVLVVLWRGPELPRA